MFYDTSMFEVYASRHVTFVKSVFPYKSTTSQSNVLDNNDSSMQKVVILHSPTHMPILTSTCKNSTYMWIPKTRF